MPSPSLPSGAAMIRRVLDAAVILEITGAAVFVIARVSERAPDLGFDFRVNVWAKAGAVLHGTPYYPTVIGRTVPSSVSAYPPLLGLIGIILRPLGPHVALIVWDLVGAGAFGTALWSVGVRDWRVLCLAFGSLPLVAATVLGQVSPLLALGIALGWKYRNRRYAPGLIAAGLIAIKLLAWPMLLWLVLTRRLRAAAIGVVATIALLILPWAAISLDGLRSYPTLLVRSGKSWGPATHSVYSLALAFGGSAAIAEAATLLCLAVMIGGMFFFARHGADLATFVTATAAGIYASPVVHPHYLLALVIVLALVRPRFSYAWILVLLLSASPQEPPPSTWRLAFGVCSGIALATYTAIAAYQIRPLRQSRLFRVELSSQADASADKSAQPTTA